LITSGLKGEFSQNEDYIKCTIKTLACLVKGELEAIPKDEGLNEKKMDFVFKVLDIISDQQILNSL